MSIDMNEPTANDLPPGFTRETFLEWRSPRYGISNPSVLTNPVWEWLIRTRKNAYQANAAFNGPNACKAGAGWCFERFGQSMTTLEDGRIIYIAGEHEDYYDADFFIYNDVVVQQPDGALTIYGYAKEAFPPTDFHSATLTRGHIVVIGNLGYAAERNFAATQVLRLNLHNFEVEKMPAGGNIPGWIHNHKARLCDDGLKIGIGGGLIARAEKRSLWENIDEWELDLTSWVWTRKTCRDWQRWTFVRKDRKRNHIGEMRRAAMFDEEQ